MNNGRYIIFRQVTTAQAFEYDGLSRGTFARDSVASANVDVTTYHDSLGRVVEQEQVR